MVDTPNLTQRPQQRKEELEQARPPKRSTGITNVRVDSKNREEREKRKAITKSQRLAGNASSGLTGLNLGRHRSARSAAGVRAPPSIMQARPQSRFRQAHPEHRHKGAEERQAPPAPDASDFGRPWSRRTGRLQRGDGRQGPDEGHLATKMPPFIEGT